MKEVSVYDFDKQLECTYNEEKYSVRDNGAVLRHPRIGKSPRPTDKKWTFGKPNDKTGYMEIASVRVHRIVATAFHGDPPTPEYVVDHIDTNRRNNWPQNLRWVTRLENALLNPITVKRIIFICGSVEAFLQDPKRLRSGKFDQNFDWMRSVSREEGQASLQRMLAWSKNEKSSKGGTLGDWIFGRTPIEPHPFEVRQESLVMAQTPGAAQRNWRTASEFPCCPQEEKDEHIASYAQKLKPGEIFSRNSFSESTVVKTLLAKDRKTLWVMCEQSKGNKQWTLGQVTFEEDLYVHTSLGTFFTNEGAEKQFCLAQELEWTGGDSIDDYC